MPTDKPTSPQLEQPFFVGYAKPPAALRRWLWQVGIVVMLGSAVAAWVLAQTQRDPGPAVWDTDSVQTMEGVVALEPYPMLLVDGQPPVLLVGPTKQNAATWVSLWAGRRARVAGHAIRRGSLLLFSLSEEPNPVLPVEGSAAPAPIARYQGTASFTGEIVDPKCFAGAMKPGDGKAHKSCAALCIRGGIPPVLIARSGETLRAWVLLDAQGTAARGELLDRLIDLVGEPVQIDGVCGDLRGLPIMKVERVRPLCVASDPVNPARVTSVR